MTIEQLAKSMIDTARARAGDDGSPMIETAKLVIALLQAIQQQQQQVEPEAGDGWLIFLRAALPDGKKK